MLGEAIFVRFCMFFPACDFYGPNFRAHLASQQFSRDKAYLEYGAFSISMRPASPPDFTGEPAALIGWGLVDDLASGIIRPARVFQSGLHILRQSFRAGIILSSPPSHSFPGCRKAKPGVTGFAQIPEIFRRVVVLVSVTVIYH